MKLKKTSILALILGIGIFMTAFVFIVPSLRASALWRLDQMRIFIRYTIFPPEEAVFVPSGAATLLPSPTFNPSSTPLADTTPSPAISATSVVPISPTPTAVPLPERVLLEGIRYQDQHTLWNYCGPANLAMALSYWGWQGTRTDTGEFLKPFPEDKSVRIAEMIDYVVEKTDLNIIVRYGGTSEMLKEILAAGFPVLIEKGEYLHQQLTGKTAWAGHYNVVVGYDEATQNFIVRDSFFSPPDYPLDFLIPYDKLVNQWRGFNYVFAVIYPPDRETQLFSVLGERVDLNRNYTQTLEMARLETQQLQDIDLFFAWFNLGSTQVLLQDYTSAGASFDQAFEIYAGLPKETRPFRMMWYQSGPYFAYYMTGRYQDVIDLTTTTIDSTDKPYLEENWYWRAKAKLALGDTAGAIADFQTSLEYHPDFTPAVEALAELGVAN